MEQNTTDRLATALAAVIRAQIIGLRGGRKPNDLNTVAILKSDLADAVATVIKTAGEPVRDCDDADAIKPLALEIYGQSILEVANMLVEVGNGALETVRRIEALALDMMGAGPAAKEKTFWN